MKKPLLFIIAVISTFAAFAQHVYDGIAPQDSTVFSFESTDTLFHSFGTTPLYTATIDTANTHLWAIGKTHKPFFAAGSADTTFAIMTDTAQPYAINSNDWFILKIPHIPVNMIVDFTHKYQVKPGHDGCVVEYSIDSGTNWQNIKGPCNSDSLSMYSQGIHTENIYSNTDTISTGDKAFTGITTSWIYSRIQFFQGLPLRLTKGTSGCSFPPGSSVYLRFRFISDSLPSPMDGWIIDDIKIEGRYFGTIVPKVGSNQTLSIYPNPSKDGLFTFPELNDEKHTELEITDALGQVIFKSFYEHSIDLSKYPKGIYLYKAVNSTEYYSGRLIVQ